MKGATLKKEAPVKKRRNESLVPPLVSRAVQRGRNPPEISAQQAPSAYFGNWRGFGFWRRPCAPCAAARRGLEDRTSRSPIGNPDVPEAGRPAGGPVGRNRIEQRSGKSRVVPTAHRPVGFGRTPRIPLAGSFLEPFARREDIKGAGDFRAQHPAQRCGTNILRLRGAVAFYNFNLKFGLRQLTAHALRDPQSVSWESPASSLRGFLFSGPQEPSARSDIVCAVAGTISPRPVGIRPREPARGVSRFRGRPTSRVLDWP
ncbi:hypothetical protein ABIF29_003481 [Bradyrhizobium elkanii]|uniref:Uncharacterized protein n=1 Tax=Bradyrhizobium elkanii TaxID=29448 RepID=A0ABV4F105_BRAEL|nr:hypothetical protein [Bradyrhizobium elkanii]MCP1757702.1 hypothetical protein [Bradyrhizobium elkanii]MCP1983216.1 hypothetical protein [Bradyrhizobium elkanii]MCS3691605.1 hypothetical protein [Bradyrhizobium elkanii]MCS3882001.1 hypothetical protein [Bradyrhizobium elkanii]